MSLIFLFRSSHLVFISLLSSSPSLFLRPMPPLSPLSPIFPRFSNEKHREKKNLSPPSLTFYRRRFFRVKKYELLIGGKSNFMLAYVTAHRYILRQRGVSRCSSRGQVESRVRVADYANRADIPSAYISFYFVSLFLPLSGHFHKRLLRSAKLWLLFLPDRVKIIILAASCHFFQEKERKRKRTKQNKWRNRIVQREQRYVYNGKEFNSIGRMIDVR